MIPAEVSSHVRTAGHVIAKDEADSIPSFGCPIVLHGRPMLLDHHVIFPHTMFGTGVLMYDDTIGAVILPDASRAVAVCPGHEYSLLRFELSVSSKKSSAISKRVTLPSQTKQNRYFTKDFIDGSKTSGPKDDSRTKFRKIEVVARNVLELNTGEDFPNTINSAATSKVAKIRKQMALLKIQEAKNRAGKRRNDRDTSVLRFPKNIGGTIVDRVAGVSALCSVDQQTEYVGAKSNLFKQRLVSKLARQAVRSNRDKNKNKKIDEKKQQQDMAKNVKKRKMKKQL